MSYQGSDWGHSVTVDFIGLFCGAKLAQGGSRIVYEHALDPKLVLKVELGAGSFNNSVEWDFWHNLRRTTIGPWLAPCIAISACGAVLVQRRTKPVERSALPKRVPALFADLKIQNWGMLDGKPVCHDYGNHHLFTIAKRSGMRVAKWWSI